MNRTVNFIHTRADLGENPWLRYLPHFFSRPFNQANKTGVHLDILQTAVHPPSVPTTISFLKGKDLIFAAEATSNSSDERDLIRNFALDEKCRSVCVFPSIFVGFFFLPFASYPTPFLLWDGMRLGETPTDESQKKKKQNGIVRGEKTGEVESGREREKKGEKI